MLGEKNATLDAKMVTVLGTINFCAYLFHQTETLCISNGQNSVVNPCFYRVLIYPRQSNIKPNVTLKENPIMSFAYFEVSYNFSVRCIMVFHSGINGNADFIIIEI